MGHGNTSCDPHLHLSHQATKRSTTSREASAAGRLRPNAGTVLLFLSTVFFVFVQTSPLTPASGLVRFLAILRRRPQQRLPFREFEFTSMCNFIDRQYTVSMYKTKVIEASGPVDVGWWKLTKRGNDG